jgi:hypothetical protein
VSSKLLSFFKVLWFAPSLHICTLSTYLHPLYISLLGRLMRHVASRWDEINIHIDYSRKRLLERTSYRYEDDVGECHRRRVQWWRPYLLLAWEVLLSSKRSQFLRCFNLWKVSKILELLMFVCVFVCVIDMNVS